MQSDEKISLKKNQTVGDSKFEIQAWKLTLVVYQHTGALFCGAFLQIRLVVLFDLAIQIAVQIRAGAFVTSQASGTFWRWKDSKRLGYRRWSNRVKIRVNRVNDSTIENSNAYYRPSRDRELDSWKSHSPSWSSDCQASSLVAHESAV